MGGVFTLPVAIYDSPGIDGWMPKSGYAFPATTSEGSRSLTHRQQIGGGLILGLALYVAYLVAAVGVFKTTLFHLLLIELSWMGIYFTLFGLSRVLDPVFESVGLNSGLAKVLSFEMLAM